ncbi:hypothetical protein LPJ59_006487, partial [Coemansia sp. RSA 2399]
TSAGSGSGGSGSKSNQVPEGEGGLPAATKKQLARVLRKVIKHPSAFPFMRPVDVMLDGCPTYYDVIKHPMDLGTVRRKLENPAGRYSSAAEFDADVRLMLSNCFTFNPAGTPVHLMGRTIESVFEKEWVKAGLSNDQAEEEKEKERKPSNKRKPSSTAALSSSQQPSEKDASSSSSTKKRSKKNNGGAEEVSAGLALDDPDAIMEFLDKTEGRPEEEQEQLPVVSVEEKKKSPAVSQPPVQQRTKGLADWRATCNRVLLRLQAQPSALEFLAPVDPVRQGVPTYSLIVKTPMDLGTVRKKLDRSIYTSANEFRRDVNLVLTNCFLFNKPGTFVHSQGEQLQSVFRAVWRQHTGAADETADLPDDLDPPPYTDVLLSEAADDARVVLNKLKRDPYAWPFLKPVDPVALGVLTYFDIVKNPMDLSTVQKKLAKKAYKWAADFVADIQLIVDDCFLFNPPDTPVNECGKALLRAAHALLDPYNWSQWMAPL